MAQPHRILIICASSPPVRCGVGDYSVALCESLATHAGLTVGFLTTAHPHRQIVDADRSGFQLLPSPPTWSPWYFGRCCRDISAWKADLIHVQWPAQGYDGPLAGLIAQWFRRWCRRPVVVTLHEHLPPSAAPFGTSRMLANAACAITSVRPDFCDGFAVGMSSCVSHKPFFFIPNASHIPRVRPTPQQAEAFRARHRLEPQQAIIAYFGLLYPDRGVEDLFSIADPDHHRLFIAGDAITSSDSYKTELAAVAAQPRWRDRATMLGFLPVEEAGLLLALADAVVLPFKHGGGIWNTSIHAARTQGTFVLSTSKQLRGYDLAHNVYWAAPGNIAEMRQALKTHLGNRALPDATDVPSWKDIALRHNDVYARFC